MIKTVDARIEIPYEKVAAFCRANKIRKMALFGSVIRDDFGPDSDVDVLVEFEPDTNLGLRYFGIEIDLSELLGRKVDMHEFRSVERAKNYVRRNHILRNYEVIYEA